jgi:hypothetical protein
MIFNRLLRTNLFAPLPRVLCLGCCAALLWCSVAQAQQRSIATPGPPGSHSELPVPDEATGSGPIVQALEAICWYLPNRIVDLTDIPRFHFGLGDGNGVSLRMTKYLLYASWFEDQAMCLGWTKRRGPLFAETIEERFFALGLARSKGDTDRDPTEIGLSFHFVAFGLNLAASGGEFIDAGLGLFGIDLMGDDYGPMFFQGEDQNDGEKVALPLDEDGVQTLTSGELETRN